MQYIVGTLSPNTEITFEINHPEGFMENNFMVCGSKETTIEENLCILRKHIVQYYIVDAGFIFPLMQPTFS
jgi:hypothetical protein